MLESRLPLGRWPSAPTLSAEAAGRGLHTATQAITAHCQQVCKRWSTQQASYITASRLGSGEDPGLGTFRFPYNWETVKQKGDKGKITNSNPTQVRSTIFLYVFYSLLNAY